MAGQINKRRTCFKYPQNIPKSDTISAPATTGSITKQPKCQQLSATHLLMQMMIIVSQYTIYGTGQITKTIKSYNQL